MKKNKKFEPDNERVLERRRQVVKDALRARKFSDEEMAEQAIIWLSFCNSVLRETKED